MESAVRRINSTGLGQGACVVYVMSRDQRVSGNRALFYAQKLALSYGLPLAVIFCLTKKGTRAREHYEFMIRGLKGVESELETRNIPFMMLFGVPGQVLRSCFAHIRPRAVVFDFSPLTGPQKLTKTIAETTEAEVYVVDAHNAIPVWVASNKKEVGARTLRPKIHRVLDSYISESLTIIPQSLSWPGTVMGLHNLSDKIDEFLKTCQSNKQRIPFESGERAAMKAVRDFIENRLDGYSTNRNKPEVHGLSDLSPYLHFGQISSVQVLHMLKEAMMSSPQLTHEVDVLVEEMIVRKELSDNFCFYSEDYKSLKSAPHWAQNTLAKHGSDTREYIYSLAEFENAKTHDSAWNAAQRQLLSSGKMHGYMRMYWAKKVLEWSPSPEEAIKTLVYLNDFYSIDGGDPSGYVGILWSVCGVHDRPWGERPVYGTIRCMVYSGLKRKFDIVAYENQWKDQ